MKNTTAILSIIITISMPVFANPIPVTISTITALEAAYLESCPCSETPDTTPKGNGKKLTMTQYYIPYDKPVEPNAPGYSLPLDLNNVGNYDSIDSRFGINSFAHLLEENGFAVIERNSPDFNDVIAPYEALRLSGVPLFVTADTLLHLYHIQFDETLMEIEQNEFFDDIHALTDALMDEAVDQYNEYDGDLKEAAIRNISFLSVAKHLLVMDDLTPEIVSDLFVAGELAKIKAHAGFAPSDIFIYEEDYSQYVPRGHYTRSDELKRYFRTLMWYGRMAFLLKGSDISGPAGDALISAYDAKIQTLQAVLLATSLDFVQVDQRSGREIWDRIYAITAFYVGLADDLTPYEYL